MKISSVRVETVENGFNVEVNTKTRIEGKTGNSWDSFDRDEKTYIYSSWEDVIAALSKLSPEVPPNY